MKGENGNGKPVKESEGNSGDTPRPAENRGRRTLTLRKVTAEILDFLTVFFAGRYLIDLFAGTARADVFTLERWQGLTLIAMIVAYFYLLSRTRGGTLWQRILKTQRH